VGRIVPGQVDIITPFLYQAEQGRYGKGLVSPLAYEQGTGGAKSLAYLSSGTLVIEWCQHYKNWLNFNLLLHFKTPSRYLLFQLSFNQA
jgi:hypothetical protein